MELKDSEDMIDASRTRARSVFGLVVLAALPHCPLSCGECLGSQFEVTVPEFNCEPRMDGLLADKCWEEAERLSNFTEFEPREGVRPEVETEVLLGYDATRLYIGFICYENKVSEIRATAAKRDAFTDNDDWVWILLDTGNTSHRGLVLAVNPRSVQVDWHTNDIEEKDDLAVDLDWRAVSRISDDRWTAEIAIPFKSLRFPPRPRQHWRVDFIRIRPRESEESYAWLPHSREDLLFTKLGHLYINERLRTNKRADVLPYVTVGADTRPGEEQSFSSKMGSSGKYWLTSDFILDWAIRPDYSQIESDEPQIDINTTFALYYPEKRPVFLERKELFETPIGAVYTRAINDPIATFKATGRLRTTDIGYIAALDQHTPWILPFAEESFTVSSNRRSLSNILRIRCELPTGSYLGFLGTSRELDESFNRVLGADAKIRFPGHHYLTFQGLASWTKEPNDPALFGGYRWLTAGDYTSGFDGEEFTGEAFTARISRRGGKYVDFDLWSAGYSPEFRADNGFMKSNDLRDRGLSVTLKLHPNTLLIEHLTPQLGFRETKAYYGGHRESCVTSSFSLVCRKQTYLAFEHAYRSRIVQGHRFSRIWTVQGTWSGNALGILFPGAVCKCGRDINYFASPPALGYALSVVSWLDFAPLPGLRSRICYARYALWRQPMKDRVYDVNTLSHRVTYSFSRHLTSRATVQYSSDAQTVEFSPLLSFEPTPFSVFYLGSNHSHRKTGAASNGGDAECRIFLKAQYLFEL